MTERAPRIVRLLRVLIFLAVAGFMVAGPIYKQVLGGREPVFRQWTMFSRIGLGLADVRFSQRLPDGTRLPVNHYELLGYPDWRGAPLALRQVMGLQGVRGIAGRLCAALGPGADVRARVRIATRAGWRTEMMEADGGLCGAPPATDPGGGGNAIGD
jgi:hypothetical protein